MAEGLAVQVASGSAGSTRFDSVGIVRAEESNVETDGDSSHGGSDEQYESIESLLSGPKDSVTMFKDSGGRPKIQFEIQEGADPLDLLAKEVQARTEVGRHKLHQELDIFLNGAVQRQAEAEASSSSQPSRVQEELEAKEREILRLRQRLQEEDQEQEEQAMTRERLSKEVDFYRQHAASLEGALQKAVMAQRELEADVASANMQVFDLKRQLHVDQEAMLAVKAMEERLTQQEKASEAAQLELRQLRGEREALQQTSAAGLADLAAKLGESLLRVQREQLRKFEKLNDEHLCVVCLEEKKNVVLRPCSHLTMCVKCFSQCSRSCPQCRAPVEGHLVIYG